MECAWYVGCSVRHASGYRHADCDAPLLDMYVRGFAQNQPIPLVGDHVYLSILSNFLLVASKF